MLDSSRVFNRLRLLLGQSKRRLLAPDLPLRCGITPIAESAALLGEQIEAAFGAPSKRSTSAASRWVG